MNSKIAEYKKALKQAEPFFSHGEASFLINAKKEVAPDRDPIEYFGKVLDFIINGGYRIISDHEVSSDSGEAVCAEQPSGPGIADLRDLDSINVQIPPYVFKLNYYGFGKLHDMRRAERPIMFVTWHNAAYYLLSYALLKIIPDTKIISAYKCRYVDKLSLPIRGNSPLGFLKMAKMLEEKTPFLHYFDGPLGKRDIEYNLFGARVYFAQGVFDLIRTYSPYVIPITGYIKGGREADIYMGNDLFPQEGNKTMTYHQMLDKLFRYFIDDLKSKEPTQFLLHYYVGAITKQTNWR